MNGNTLDVWLRLWVVDYVNDCRASCVSILRSTREFRARVFKKDGITEKTVAVVVPPARENVCPRLERDQVLHRLPGYVKGQRVHAEDLPEGLIPAVPRAQETGGVTDNERSDDMKKRTEKVIRKPRGGLAADMREAQAEEKAASKRIRKAKASNGNGAKVSYKGRPEYIEKLVADGKTDAEIRDDVKVKFPGSSKGTVATIIDKKRTAAKASATEAAK